jgi:hypothetical protein
MSHDADDRADRKSEIGSVDPGRMQARDATVEIKRVRVSPAVRKKRAK